MGSSQPLTSIPLVKVATCNLAQLALNYDENKRRILESIWAAKKAGCAYRLGPELEVPGYGCEDHFYEMDTTTFSWITFNEILKESPDNILCDIGMPILHNGVLYNCRVFFMKTQINPTEHETLANKIISTIPAGQRNRNAPSIVGSRHITKILLIRPKMYLADDGIYREGRYFTGWPKERMETLDRFVLPEEIRNTTGQTDVPFGVAILDINGVTIASEVCEELFTPESPNVQFGLEGVDILSNGSGSLFQMGKRKLRHNLIQSATNKNGGVYMYANQLGCDGGRQIYDGNGMIYQNGALLNVGEHISFHEMELVTAVVNLNAVRTYRSSVVSRNIQSARKNVDIPRIYITKEEFPAFHIYTTESETVAKDNKIYSMYDPAQPMSEYEEMSRAVARYLWDYLVISNHGGFFLPLSGGVDSSSTAMLVYVMCDLLVRIADPSKATKVNEEKRLQQFISKKLSALLLSGYQYQDCKEYYTTNGSMGTPLTTRELMYIVLHTANMPTKNNTGKIRNFAENLAHSLGSYHITAHINDAFVEMKNLVEKIEIKDKDGRKTFFTPEEEELGKNKANLYYINPDTMVHEPPAAESRFNIPRQKDEKGGDWKTHLAIQNIQARLRMLTAFYCAQILPLNRFNQEVLGEVWKGYVKARTAAIRKIQSETSNNKRNEEIAFLQALKTMAENTIPRNLLETVNSISTFFKIDPKNPITTYTDLHRLIIARIRPDTTKNILVLASSNSDEAIRGFYTKYDASSADINPIGSFNKTFLKEFLSWSAENVDLHDPNMKGYQFNMLEDIVNVVASPELTEATTKTVNGKRVEIISMTMMRPLVGLTAN